ITWRLSSQALAGDPVPIGVEPMRVVPRPTVVLVEPLGSFPTAEVRAVLVGSWGSRRKCKDDGSRSHSDDSMHDPSRPLGETQSVPKALRSKVAPVSASERSQ